jgi:hypothetical protein
MALNNCSITSQSFSRQSGTAIGADNATLIITPAQGYVLNATDFSVGDVTYANNGNNLQWTSGSNGVTLPTGVASITLSNTGVANSVGNNISVLVDLTDSFVMPAADTTLVIDIDGSANLQSYSLSGNYSTTVSGATPSSESSTYSGSGNFGQQVTVLTKVFSADSGAHFETLPSYVLTAKNPSRYDISRTTTGSDSDGNVTQVTFTIKYTFSNESETGDSIAFTANTVTIFSPTVEIQDYGLRTIVIETIGEEREMTVFGVPGAQFSLTVQNQASQSILSISNQTLDSTGSHSFTIEFPGILATATDQYDFVLTGDGVSTNFGGTNQKPHTFSIKQLGDITVQAGLTHTSSDVTISANKSITARANRDLADEGDLAHSFTITSDKFLVLTSPTVDLTTFTNLNNNGGTQFIFDSLTFTIVNNNQITATLDAEVDVIGNQNVTTLYSLDTNIKVNNKSSVEDFETTVKRNSLKEIILAGQDIDGDNLTFEIVDPPQNGSLAVDSNGDYNIVDFYSRTLPDGTKQIAKKIDYTHDGSTNYTDEFTFKAKDPYEDSTNIGTVDLTIQNDAPIIRTVNGQEVSNNAITLSDEYFPGETLFVKVVASDPNNDLFYWNVTQPANGGVNDVNIDNDSEFFFNFFDGAGTTDTSSQITVSVNDGDLSDNVTITINYVKRPTANPNSFAVNKGGDKEITLTGDSNGGGTLSYIIETLPTNGDLYIDQAKQTQIVQSGLPYTLSSATVYYEHDNSTNLDDSFNFKVNNTSRDSYPATIGIAVGVPATNTSITVDNVSQMDGTFIFPIVLGTDSGNFQVHVNSRQAPDRFQLLFDENDSTNTEAGAQVVADTLFVGDSLGTTSDPGTSTLSAPKYTYVGANGNGAQLAGTNASIFNAETDANGNVVNYNIARGASTRVINTGQNLRTSSKTNHPSQSGTTQQKGVIYPVFTSATATTPSAIDREPRDGNIAIEYNKPSTTKSFTIFLRVFGGSTNTIFDIFKTIWTPDTN